jgi:hypothetical protein
MEEEEASKQMEKLRATLASATSQIQVNVVALCIQSRSLTDVAAGADEDVRTPRSPA